MLFTCFVHHEKLFLILEECLFSPDIYCMALFMYLPFRPHLLFIFQELSLKGLGLNDVPSEVWESSEIIKVDLSKNSIQELPAELSSCASLHVMSLFLSLSLIPVVFQVEMLLLCF